MQGNAPAVVLVDHGSREPGANRVLEGMAALLRSRVPTRLIYLAHMELAAPGLADAIASAYGDGAREIDVLPYFLAPGRHIRDDIPRMVAEAAARHPGLEIRVRAPLGIHASLADVLLDRLSEDGDPSRIG